MKQSYIKLFGILLILALLASFAACVGTSEEPDIIQEEPVVTDPVIEEPVIEPFTETEDPEEFVVTEEIYQQTFDDVESLIAQINDTVRTQNYDEWIEYLTEDYIEYYSDKDVLKKIGDDLYKSMGYRVRLRTLKDYFLNVVVSSRLEVGLDKIEFLDENRVTAEAIVNETPYILYYLEKKNEEWKVGKW